MGGEREEDKMRGENRKTTKKGKKGKGKRERRKNKRQICIALLCRPYTGNIH
jgi:hypothetical protein